MPERLRLLFLVCHGGSCREEPRESEAGPEEEHGRGDCHDPAAEIPDRVNTYGVSLARGSTKKTHDGAFPPEASDRSC